MMYFRSFSIRILGSVRFYRSVGVYIMCYNNIVILGCGCFRIFRSLYSASDALGLVRGIKVLVVSMGLSKKFYTLL